jgi:hypothetical protein
VSFDFPKPIREAKVDLSGLTEAQILIRRGVISLGERAFGPRWQSFFATALSEVAGRRITQAQVSQWISGSRPVPDALFEPTRRLAIRAAEDLERRAAEIRMEWAPAAPEEDKADLATLA